MKPEHKKYILENIGKKSVKEISSCLGIEERKVKKFITARQASQDNLPEESRPQSKKTAIAVCIIIMTVAAAFAPAVKNDFINWDDIVYVTANPYIKNISLNNIKTLLTASFQGTYQPFVNLTYLLEYRFFGLNPSFYHATNILLHLFNCLLVFRIFIFLNGGVWVALLSALLFGVHPLRVESVAWVSERKDVLYSLFFLWALLNYCYYAKKGAVKYYYRALVLFFLSLGSKAMAVTLPVVFFAIDYLLKRQYNKKILLEKIPFFLLAFIFGVIAIFAQGKSLGIGQGEHFDLLRQISAAFYGVIMYAYKTFLPINLSLIYPYPSRDVSYLIICSLSAIFIISVVSIAIISRKYTRKVIFSLLFAFITILPVLQLVPVGSAIMADRYTYLPSIAISYLVSVGFFYLYSIKNKLSPVLRAAEIIFLVGLIAGLSFLTYRRAEAWKNSITIFSDVIERYPKAYMAYNNRGAAYLNENSPEKALADFEKSLQINSNQFGVYNNLGALYNDLSMPEKAIDVLKKAIALNPDFEGTYNNLGNSYSSIGKKEEAIEAYRKAIELNPRYAEAYNNLGTELQDPNEAVKAYQKAIENMPDYADAYYNMAKSFERLGDSGKAASLYKKARAINPRLP